jgi:hypothetical protein
MLNTLRGPAGLAGFVACVLAVGIACSSLVPTPSASTQGSIEAAVPTQPSQPSEAAAQDSTAVTGPATFTDQNGYFEIDLPAEWTYTQDIDTENNYWYWDVFTAPDGHAKLENIVYDDGTAWTGSQNGKQALYLLNKFYSNTGAEGDIRISKDSIQNDGSERLSWSSRGGGYSGVSFFEVRNRTAFLMLTAWWDNEYANKYQDVLDEIVSSYRTP